ncbi:MAG: c-type cytochrome [Acidobacteriota bacterium]|nr:c-type cytochrome [Acidobacteriota bacterium]
MFRAESARRRCFLPAAILLVSSLWWADGLTAQNVLSRALQERIQENPHTTEADVEAGARVFRRSCSLCHGPDGTGGDGPDLTRGVFRHGSSDAALFRNILTGIRNTGMGGIYQPDKSIWQVVSYVRSLSRAVGEEEVPGDPRRGRLLYMSRGSCSDCHRLNGSGGRIGPDLSDLGWQRAPAHIRASIIDPAESIGDDYRTVEVRTRDGGVVRGVLRNEDRYSIQLLDEFENLRSFQKADLAAIEKPEESLMPPLSSFFRGRDLDDLVAYLYSLRPE